MTAHVNMCSTHSRHYYNPAYGYLPTDYIYTLACFTFPKCFIYNTLFKALTRCRCHCTSDIIRKFFLLAYLGMFVVILICISFSTIHGSILV